MKSDYPKGRDKFVSIILLGVSGLLVVLVSLKVMGFVTASARAESLVKNALEQGKPDAKEMEKHLADSKAIVDDLKKMNLFAPPPPKQHPVKEVTGILGNEAIIDGKLYKVGDKIGDAKIVAIDTTRVRIEWEGKEKVFSPIGVADSSASAPGPRRPGRPDMAARAGGGRRGGAEMVVVGPGGRRSGRGGFGSLSSEERERMRARWESMSERERQEFRERMRERSSRERR
jgi:hypothetical protein